LTNNVGVEVDGKRRIGYVKVTGALSKIIIDGVLISNLSANPKSQDNLVFETYFDYDMMWGNSLDLRYSNIKKLKIKNLDWLSNLKLNADLECINSDNNQLFNDVLVNGSIKTFRNNTYYTLTRNLETPWGDWEQYYYWYISEKVLDILSDNCFH
jgi:hypothetical protein